MVKIITTSIDEKLHEEIKKSGLKISSLISRGYLCFSGKCPNTITIETTKNEELKKKEEEINKLQNQIKEMILKHNEETKELRIVKTNLATLLKHIIKKYNIDIEKEINEVFKDYEFRAIELFKKHNIF